MKINFSNLHKHVGLKINEAVFYDFDTVKQAILDHKELFDDIQATPIQDSHMLYGYNKLGNPVKLGFEGELIKRIIVDTLPILTKRYKVVIGYDGHNYSGFQIQKNSPTIQGELTKVISAVNGIESLIQGASRTDAGVHAINYVFHFDSDKSLTSDRWMKYLNHQLPDDIYIKSVDQVHPLFHSRYDVFKKRYVYRISFNDIDPLKVNYKWFTKKFNTDLVKKNIEQLIGKHDFSSFCKGSSNSNIRTIYKTELIEDDGEVVLVFEGDGFLRYMIRILVNALVEIGYGNLEKSISELIKERSREHTKNLAPACGLYLEEITY